MPTIMMGGRTTPRESRAVTGLFRVAAALCVIAALMGLPPGRPRPHPVPGWFAALPAGDPPRGFDAGSTTRKVRQQRETRNAFVARPGSTITLSLQPQSATQVQVAMTVLCPPGRTCTGDTTFRVSARHGEHTELLREFTVTVAPGGAPWQTEWIDLARFAGSQVALELQAGAPVATGTSSPARGHPLPVWGEPLVVDAASARSDRPNIVLISLDTLRPDHLGCYGAARPTSPVIDAFAADSVRFTQAVSQAPWTTPSHMSLFTSQYPSAHRMNQTWEYFTAFIYGHGQKRTLADRAVTLAEVLQQHGYRTLALTGGATMSGVLGFAQGFDVYREDAAKLTPRVPVILNDWLAHHGREPFFLFFHTFEVHAPYHHLTFAEPLLTPEQRRDLTDIVASANLDDWVTLNRRLDAYLTANGLRRAEITTALYDGGIQQADAFIGQLLAMLRQHDLYDNTIVVLLSDHGEEFGEHDRTQVYNAHGTSLYDQLVRVPLIMHAPAYAAPRVVDTQVELIDVAPTLLELAGLPAAAVMQGSSLVPLLAGRTVAPHDWALSEATEKGLEWKSLRTEQHKYLLAFDPHGGERSGLRPPIKGELLFDLRRDPGEQQSLISREPERRGAMRAQLEQLLRQVAVPAHEDRSIPIAPDVTERLRALGYAE